MVLPQTLALHVTTILIITSSIRSVLPATEAVKSDTRTNGPQTTEQLLQELDTWSKRKPPSNILQPLGTVGTSAPVVPSNAVARQGPRRDPGNRAAWYTEFWVPYYAPWSQDPFTSPALVRKLPPLGPVVDDATLTNYAGVWDQNVYGAGTDIYWMGTKKGACGYGDLRNPFRQPRSQSPYPYMNGAALTPALISGLGMKNRIHGVACGACIKVTCNDEYYCPAGPRATSAVAMVVDFCPPGEGCIKGAQLDMFRATFLKASGNSSSNPKARIQRVMCPDPLRNIELRVGINKGPSDYLKVMFSDVAGYGVITRVILSCCMDNMGTRRGDVHYCSNGRRSIRMELVHSFGAYWKTRSVALKGPFCQFMIYQEDGSMLLTRLPRRMKMGSGKKFWAGEYVDRMDTGVQFYQTVKTFDGKRVSGKKLARSGK